MAYRSPNYIPVIVMMAVALAGTLAFARKPDNITAQANVSAIPNKQGHWKLESAVTLDENVMQQIRADSYIDRWYVGPSGQRVELLVVYRRYGRREFAHRPELCFPAAGYTITEKGKTTLPYAGREVPAVHLKANAQGGDRRILSYFFASGKKTEEDFMQQQLWMAFERLIPNKNGWTFIRLQSPTITTDADAVAAQKDFMRAFAPAIEAVITTDRTPAAPLAAGDRAVSTPAPS